MVMLVLWLALGHTRGGSDNASEIGRSVPGDIYASPPRSYPKPLGPVRTPGWHRELKLLGLLRGSSTRFSSVPSFFPPAVAVVGDLARFVFSFRGPAQSPIVRPMALSTRAGECRNREPGGGSADDDFWQTSGTAKVELSN